MMTRVMWVVAIGIACGWAAYKFAQQNLREQVQDLFAGRGSLLEVTAWYRDPVNVGVLVGLVVMAAGFVVLLLEDRREPPG
jgi:hypothetical protein